MEEETIVKEWRDGMIGSVEYDRVKERLEGWRRIGWIDGKLEED